MFSTELLHYFARVTPATLVFIIYIFLIPRSAKILRIISFILLFALFRDAMTPEGLWSITPSLEIRFIPQPFTLLVLGLSSVGLIILSHFEIESLWSRKLWVNSSPLNSVITGFVAGVLIALLPFFFRIATARVPYPRPTGATLVTAILALTFLGNFLEETLFRGHFQTYLEELRIPQAKVIILSGLTFCVFHTFLAFTVTEIGWPILAFTFYEGTICAYLRAKQGLLSAALAHSFGLFLIGTGLL